MTPIKLDDFLRQTASAKQGGTILDLTELGLYHAAPQEDGKLILSLRFDPKSNTLLPAA